jgi:hypothetical protein
MRRQTSSGAGEACPQLGSSWIEPSTLPVRLTAPAAGIRHAVIDQETVRLVCDGEGASVICLLSVRDYAGVVLTTTRRGASETARIELRHAEPSASLLIAETADADALPRFVALWREWACALALAALLEAPNGTLEEAPPVPRRAVTRRAFGRRASSVFAGRRMSGALRRSRAWQTVDTGRVSGREIIARD